MDTKTLFIETYGCQMNVNDSERIRSMLADSGYSNAENQADADMILLNTCTIRGGAEEKVYRRLQNLRMLKKANKNLIFAVGGCVAQQEGEELLRKFPWLDIVFGTHNLHLLPDLVKRAESGEQSCETSFLDNDQRLDLFPTVQGANRFSSFVTVMQGCDNYCSYCIVPYVRGREVSRRSAEILDEVGKLVEQGVSEIVLLGQNVNSYGMKSDSEPDFSGLLRMVAEIEGVQRIRFTTSHPKDMSDELINCFVSVPKLCKHIHLPAQAGSNNVLSRMKRGYTREQYMERISAIKAICPDIAITGDIIVGFPGESDEDFEQTMTLLEEVRYSNIFSFVYSPRSGTKAADFADELSSEQKLSRLERLQKFQRKIAHQINDSYLGSRQTVLVEGVAKWDGQVSGRTESGCIVNFPGESSLIGKFVELRIVATYQNSLLGELL